jgi:hypothetical protein
MPNSSRWFQGSLKSDIEKRITGILIAFVGKIYSVLYPIFQENTGISYLNLWEYLP